MDAAFWSALRVTLARVDDAGFDEVHILASGDVVAFGAVAFLDFLHDERAFLRRRCRRAGAERSLDGAADDAGTDLLVSARA
jgi:hypothetical protein